MIRLNNQEMIDALNCMGLQQAQHIVPGVQLNPVVQPTYELRNIGDLRKCNGYYSGSEAVAVAGTQLTTDDLDGAAGGPIWESTRDNYLFSIGFRLTAAGANAANGYWYLITPTGVDAPITEQQPIDDFDDGAGAAIVWQDIIPAGWRIGFHFSNGFAGAGAAVLVALAYPLVN